MSGTSPDSVSYPPQEYGLLGPLPWGTINAGDYGIVGDDSYDNTLRMQTAINTAASLGAPLYLPPGTYQTGPLTLPSGFVRLWGAGNRLSILKRKNAATTTGSILSASGLTGFSIVDVAFDGNKANQTLGSNSVTLSACSDFKLERVRSVNAKTASGYGAGFVLNQLPSTNTTGREVLVRGCEAYENDDAGLVILRTGAGVTVDGGDFSDNTGDGVSFYDQGITPAANTVPNMIVRGVRAERNGGAGITLRGFYVVGLNGVLTYGHGSDPVQGLTVVGCQANYNTGYGIFVQGTGATISGNTTRNNGTTANAGICANAQSVVISNNVVSGNLSFGIDAGGCLYGAITGNQVTNNGTADVLGTGINLGACQYVVCSHNALVNNGTTEIYIPRNDSGSYYFPWDAIAVHVCDNQIINTLSASHWGILTNGLPDGISILNNRFTWPDASGFNAIRGGLTTGRIAGNMLNGSVSWTANAAASISYPEWADVVNINSNAAIITSLLSASQGAAIQKLTGVVLTNRGSGYTADFDVTVTGGGGSGATARARVTQDGRIAAVTFTAGSGYTGTPTLDFSAGSGTGAAATVLIGIKPLSGKELRFIAFGSDFRMTASSVLLPSYSGATLTISSRGSTLLYSIEDKWYPAAIESGNGWHYYADGRVDADGSGTPEGAVTALIGSTYRRSDGGAGTSFYVKESGTGNTGWVAK